MKKLFALLTALILAMGCGAACADGWAGDNSLSLFLSGGSAPAVETLDGEWQVEYVERSGEIIPAAQAGVTGKLTVNGDSGRWTHGDSSSLGIVSQDATGVTLMARAGDFVFVLNAQGYLCLTTAEGVLWLSRGDLAAPVVEAPATNGWAGGNALSAFLSGGSAPAVEEPVVEEPVIEEPVVEAPVSSWAGGNALSAFLSGGSAPEEEPVVEEPVIEEPVVEAPVSSWAGGNALSSLLGGGAAADSTPAMDLSDATAIPAGAFAGTWRVVSAYTLGMHFSAEALSLTGYELHISDDAARYVVNGRTVVDGRLMSGSSGTAVADARTAMPCHINEGGQLILEVKESGVRLELTMQRVDESSGNVK